MVIDPATAAAGVYLCGRAFFTYLETRFDGRLLPYVARMTAVAAMLGTGLWMFYIVRE